MKEFGQERSTQAAMAPVPSPSAGPSRNPLPAWDRRTWLVTIPLALIVIYAFIPILDNGFVARGTTMRTSSTTPISVVWAQPR